MSSGVSERPPSSPGGESENLTLQGTPQSQSEARAIHFAGGEHAVQSIQVEASKESTSFVEIGKRSSHVATAVSDQSLGPIQASGTALAGKAQLRQSLPSDSVSQLTIMDQPPAVGLASRVVPLGPREKKALADAPEGSEAIDTSHVVTHIFLEKRIGENTLQLADRLASHDEKERDQVSKELLSSLTTYKGTDVVGDFVRTSLGLHTFTIKPFVEAGSGANVYGVFVPAKENESTLAYVVKTLPGSPQEFAKELSSLSRLSNLNLDHSSCPRAQGVGKYEQADKVHTMFIQTAAKGSQFSDLLKAVGKLPQGPERQEALNRLKDGFRALAVGLAELHLKNQTQSTAQVSETIKTTLLTWFQEAYQANREFCVAGKIPLTPDEIDKIKSQLLENIENNWGDAGYAHGDAHLDNMFYDLSTGQLSFIDTPLFLSSIGDTGIPQGFPNGDIAWVLISLLEKGARGGLSSDEVHQLQDEFRATYDQKIGEKTGSTASLDLAVVEKYFHAIEIAHLELSRGVSEVEQEQRQRVITFACKELKKLIQ